MFNEDIIRNYADKLLIGLSGEEVQTLLSEFDVIKEKMDIIESIPNIGEVEPLSFPQEIEVFSLREGNEIKNIDTKEALSNSEDVIEDVVSVPKVVG